MSRCLGCLPQWSTAAHRLEGRLAAKRQECGAAVATALAAHGANVGRVRSSRAPCLGRGATLVRLAGLVAVPLRGAAVQIASCWLGRVCGEAVPGGATVELGWLEAAVRGARLLPAWGVVSGCMAGYGAQWCKPTPVPCVAYPLPRFSGHADGTVA